MCERVKHEVPVDVSRTVLESNGHTSASPVEVLIEREDSRDRPDDARTLGCAAFERSSYDVAAVGSCVAEEAGKGRRARLKLFGVSSA